MKVDAIFMSAVSGTGTISAVENAVAAGIPVITGNSTSETNKVSCWVRSDDVVIGQTQADAMAQFLKGKGNVVMLRGPAGTSWAENRGNAFKARLAEKYPGLKVIGERYLLSSPVDGMRIMEDFLQTYPKIDGVYNGSDAMAIGAAQAVSASGNSGKIVITTTDLQPDAENFMRKGTIHAAVIQQAVLIGRVGIRATVNILEKRAVPKTIFVPLLQATRENLSSIDMSGVRAPQGWKPPNR
jgi:ABC-type sugar transport system substrate-binding protein